MNADLGSLCLPIHNVGDLTHHPVMGAMPCSAYDSEPIRDGTARCPSARLHSVAQTTGSPLALFLLASTPT